MLIHDGDPQGWTLKALREAGNSLMSELYGLDERTLRQRPAEGEWSLKEIAAHMRDAEDLALKQMTAIIERVRRPLPATDIDLLPHEHDYRSQDLEQLLSEYRALRQQTTTSSGAPAIPTGAGRRPTLSAARSRSARSPASWPSMTSSTSGRCGR